MVERLLLGDLFAAMGEKFGHDDRTLATRLGLTGNTISAMSGRQVNVDHARQFCEAVGIDLSDVIARPD